LREKSEVHSFEGLAPRGAVYSNQEAAAQLAAFHDAAAQLAAAQLAAAQDALFHEAAAHEALDHEACAHEALFQDALAHEAELHDALFHEALFQEAFAVAVLAQLAESKASPPAPSEPTNWFSARFGFGGLVTCVAAFALTSPTPSAMPAAVGCAVSMSAPLT
jgi:hypothetical protein